MSRNIKWKDRTSWSNPPSALRKCTGPCGRQLKFAIDAPIELVSYCSECGFETGKVLTGFRGLKSQAIGNAIELMLAHSHPQLTAK